jgi:hypothetical protein
MLILLFFCGEYTKWCKICETELIHSKKNVEFLTLEDIDKQPKIWTLKNFYSVVTAWSFFLTKYYSGDEIKNREMDGVCSTYGGQESCMQGFGTETCWKETVWKI